MPTIDWNAVQQAKELHRQRVEALSFAEKLQTLERLREREEQLRRMRAIDRFAALESKSVVGFAGLVSQSQPLSATLNLFTLGATATLVAVMTQAQNTAAANAQSVLSTREPVAP